MSTEGKSTVGGVSWRIRWQYALIIVAAAILFFWEPIDDWLNFQTETVEVKAVQTLCTAFDKASPVPREVGPCVEIRAEYGSNALVDIREQTFAAFDYTSPADGRVHSTKIVRDKDDAGQPIHAGSRISVQLSSKQADFVK